MSTSRPAGAFDFARFCDWLAGLRSDPLAGDLLRVILGEPDGADLDAALRRARRVSAAMTPEERHAPRRIDRDRRAELADMAGVHPGDVSELILRYDAAAALVHDDPEVRAMVLRRNRPLAPPDPFPALQERLQRDLLLWEFHAD